MEWRVTVLCENSVPFPGVLGEHGFAAYIESPGGNYLFDTGGGFTLIQNANSMRLKKDLTKIEKVILSHGHFDHTGGLMPLIGFRGPTQVVAHEHTFLMRYRLMPMGPVEKNVAIGIPWSRQYLEGRGVNFQLVDGLTEVGPSIFVSGEVPRQTDFEKGDPKFSALIDGELVPDPFLDDFSLYIKSSKGLIVVMGCAHTGTVNILKHAAESLGEEKVYALLGGTHLDFCSPVQVEKTIAALKDFEVEKIAVSHCTGLAPAAAMAQEFGRSFAFAPVSFSLEV